MCTCPNHTSDKFGRRLREPSPIGFHTTILRVSIHPLWSSLFFATSIMFTIHVGAMYKIEGRTWMAALIQAMVKTHWYSILYNSRSISSTAKYIVRRWTSHRDPNRTKKTIILWNKSHFFPLTSNGRGSLCIQPRHETLPWAGGHVVSRLDRMGRLLQSTYTVTY